MRIKIFERYYILQELEESINKFCSDTSLNIVSIQFMYNESVGPIGYVVYEDKLESGPSI